MLNRRLERLVEVAEAERFKLLVIYQGLDFHARAAAREHGLARDLDFFSSRFARRTGRSSVFGKPLVIWSGTPRFTRAELAQRDASRGAATLLDPGLRAQRGRLPARRRRSWTATPTTGRRSTRAPIRARPRSSRRWAEAIHARGGLWIAPAAPGFDARLVGGTSVVERRGGATLRAELDAATSSSPDAIGLISWNEFSENTHVEPSRSYGSRYLRRGRRRARREASGAPRLRLERAGGHGRQLRRAAARRAGPVHLRTACARPHPSTVGKPPIGGLSGPSRGAPRLESPWSSEALTVALGLIAACPAERRRRSGDHGRRRHRVRSRGSGLQRRCGDGRPLPPAGDVGSARRHAAGRGAAARRHPVRQRLDCEDQRRLRPHLGAGEVDQPADPRQPRERSGTGYFDYFNGAGVADGPAGPRGKGYYSFDLGAWHLVALNSNCSSVSCSAGSEQEQLAARRSRRASGTSCTLAYWHHPRYSSGHDGSNTFMQPLWEALHDAQAEILLSGHSHDYERFAPLDRNGDVDQRGGIRQFVVGTGGAFFTGGLGTLSPAQRGRAEQHLRRAQAHAAPDELRLAVRPRGGQDVHRFRVRRPAMA